MIRQIGRYRIEEEIGRGGMAVVYRAQDIQLERAVALKLLAAHLEEKGVVMERFAQEARIIASLEHPHIVPIYDYGVFEKRPFLVMRLMRGGTFRERLSKGTMSMEALWPISMQIAAALDDAHDHGVVHRDIKPSNLLFDNYDRIYVSDFGVAKMTGSTTRITKRRRILGTPAYMSPEQCAEVDTDGRSDQYSLAVVLYEALAGQTPFSGDTLGLMYKHTHEPPLPLHELNETYPPEYSKVLTRALAKDPDERFESTTAFVTLLQQASLSVDPLKPETNAEPINADFVAGKEALDQENWRVAIRYFSRVGFNDPYYGRAIRFKRDARRQLGKSRPKPTTESSEVAIRTPDRAADTPAKGLSVASLLSRRAKPGAGGASVRRGTSSTQSTGTQRNWAATLRTIVLSVLALFAILIVAALIVAVLSGSGDYEETPSPTTEPATEPAVEEPEPVVVQPDDEEILIPSPEPGLSLMAESAGSGARWRSGEKSDVIAPGELSAIPISLDQDLTITTGPESLQLELPSGERLYLNGDTEIIIQALTNGNESEETLIEIRQGRLVAETVGDNLRISNPFGANIFSSDAVIGVLASAAPHRFYAACLVSDGCEVEGEGEAGDPVILKGGQSSEVGGQGDAGSPQPARVELFSDLSNLVPTATAMVKPSETARPAETPTATRQPRVPTQTPRPPETRVPPPTVVGDIDLDGVLDDVDACPGQYGPGDRKGCPSDHD